MPSQLSPQWLCGNSCTWAHDVIRKMITKNMCILATEAVKIQCGQKCSFPDKYLEELWVVTICIVRYQLVAESNFSKLNKVARVDKTINWKCRAKGSGYEVI